MTYALVDANSFYASCESVFRPDWRGKPIIVLSNNDGCIVAANRQAIELGIKKFEPYFKVKDMCEIKGIIALSSNYELYSDLSMKMMGVIGRFAPEQYIYSIDESFLSFKRTYPAIPCLLSHCMNLRRAVWKECRLPVAVGVSKTLTLAKIANHAAKKLGYRGVCVLEENKEIEAVLKQLPVSSVWGIGSQLSLRMKLMGINTAWDLASAPIDKIKRNFSVDVERTVRELNGQECLYWDSVRPAKRQIFSTRSMGERITDQNSLEQALTKHACIAAKKAREQGSLCKTIMFFAGNSPHDESHRSFRFLHEFTFPTSDSLHLSQVATCAAEALFQEGIRYYKIGAGLISLIDGKHYQNDLFNETPVNDELMHVLDSINHKYGSDTLFVGSQGINPKWGMRRDMLTPRYTTQWGDIPRIKCS
ncbi:Y-family DNA polymerase [Vibrio vulnificus]|uniref:Error-prone, lesion bypass DNA polymerase V (UmuC) n=1 Tax=Vibrio vulnificus TaxID=672 RepID=A0AAN1PVB4_VIBVL|nr:Y-family DNA polymerase [Vibrio vulnificus]AXX63373.1 Error-prone, lesion bypass DNA polymerase V (UmuC) [Vibrio vulnificus]